MYIDNITNDSMTLTYNGKSMLIKVYEEEIERLKEQLNDEIDDELKQSEIMVNKQEEIERLKEEYMILQNASDEVEEELQQRIDKAIEYIEEYKRTYENDEYCFDNMIEDVIPLLDILKGVDK